MSKLKISITTEQIGFSILDKLRIGPVIVLGNLFSDLRKGMALRYFSSP